MKKLMNVLFSAVILISVFESMGLASCPGSWVPMSGNQYNMPIDGDLYLDGSKINTKGYCIGAFGPGGESDCRGKRQVDDDGYYYLTVLLNTYGETISFKVYDQNNNQIYNINETVVFKDENDKKTSFDLTIIKPSVTLTLTGVLVEGPDKVNENSSGSYTAKALFSDGTTQDVTRSALWSVDSSYATVDSSGKLTTKEVPSDQAVTVRAEYTHSSGKKSGSKSTTISNVQQFVEPQLSVTPQSRSADLSAGTMTFEVSNAGGGTMYWTASIIEGSGWLSITSGTGGTNNGTIKVTFVANQASSSRTGRIRITASGAQGSPSEVTLVQGGKSISSEICDNLDNDGDGKVDEDLTRPCSTACGTGIEACQNGQWINCTSPQPQPEVCDSKDNDCDGQVDEGVMNIYYRDADGDGYGGVVSTTACSSPGGFVSNNIDCDDSNRDVHLNCEACLKDDSGKIDIEETNGMIGNEVRIPVRIQVAPKAINSLGFDVIYDPSVLEYSGFEKGNLVGFFDFFNTNPMNSGSLRVGGFSSGANIPQGASGNLVWLKFKVKGGMENQCYPLWIDALTDDIGQFSKTGGCFCIHQSCNGDVNNDGSITPSDALVIFKCYLGSGPCSDCADVNQDGNVTPSDALCVFKNYLGQSSCLDMETQDNVPKSPTELLGTPVSITSPLLLPPDNVPKSLTELLGTPVLITLPQLLIPINN